MTFRGQIDQITFTKVDYIPFYDYTGGYDNKIDGFLKTPIFSESKINKNIGEGC